MPKVNDRTLTSEARALELVSGLKDGAGIAFDTHAQDGRLLVGVSVVRKGAGFWVATEGEAIDSVPSSLIGTADQAAAFVAEHLRLERIA